jgi:hypothetical protein
MSRNRRNKKCQQNCNWKTVGIRQSCGRWSGGGGGGWCVVIDGRIVLKENSVECKMVSYR